MQKFVQTLFALGILMYCSAATHAQTVTQTFSSAPVQVNGAPTALVYPTFVQVSGMPGNITDLKVHLKGLIGIQDNFEILLESPDGTRCILYSDASELITFALFDISLGMGAKTVWPYWNSENIYLPPNRDVGTPDIWPAPGPGQVDQPQPTLAVFEGKNPNGLWKLYLLDNTAPYGISIANGFDLEITASGNAPCVRPGLVKSFVSSPTAAYIEWNPNGQNQFEIWLGDPAAPAPTVATSPTLSNLPAPSATLPGLTPSTNYALYLRTSCAANAKSAWVGPLLFRTEDNIQALCDTRKIVSQCDTIFLDNTAAGNFFTKTICNNEPEYTGAEAMFEFTPTVTGTYFLEERHTVDWLVHYSQKTGCAASDFTCYPGSMDLVAGQPVKILIDQKTPDAIPQDWFIVQKPGGSWPPVLQAVATTYAVVGNPGTELVYAPAPFKPTDQTLPNDAGILSGTSSYRTTVPMQPNTAYHLWQRLNYDGKIGCWAGPLAFTTRQYCGKLTDFVVENSSGNSVDFRFKSQGIQDNNFTIFFGAAPLGSPEGVSNNFTQFNLTAVPVNGEHRYTLDILDPNTSYQAYFRPFCSEPTDWFGPVSFSTNQKCNPVAQTIGVGQSATLIFDAGSPLFEVACRSYQRIWGKTTFLRFKPTTTGVYGFRQKNAVNTTGGEQFAHYALHEVEDDCDDENWYCLAELNVLSGNIFYSDTLFAGKTYLIQVTPTYKGDPNTALQTDLEIVETPNGCPQANGLQAQVVSAGSADLVWQAAVGVDSFQIAYGKADLTAFPTSAGALQKTVAGAHSTTISGLENNSLYKIWVRAICPANAPGPWSEPVLLATTAFYKTSEGLVTRCSPFLDEGSETRFFERWSFTPATSGMHYFWANCPDFDALLTLHEGVFYGPDVWEGQLVRAADQAPGQAEHLSADLQAGQPYSLVVSQLAPATPFSGQVNTLLKGRVRFFAGSPGPISAGNQSDIRGRSFSDRGSVQRIYSQTFEAGMGCRDTLGWVHYLHDAGTEDYPKDDILLLSIQPGGNDLGSVEDQSLRIADFRPSNQFAVQITNPPALYVNNPGGWYVLNKWWAAEPLQQPADDISVRYYFEDAEFQMLRQRIIQNGGIPPAQYSDLWFYKINGNYDPDPTLSHAGIPAATAYDADGFWQYKNGTAASTSEWKLGISQAGEPYCEMVIARFSGGGGGAAGSPGGAVQVQETTGYAPMPLLLPNPVRDILTIEFPGRTDPYPLSVEVFDLSGRLLLQENLVGPKAEVRFAGLPAGMYFLKTRTPFGLSSSRIIVRN
jgi:hypothetical protein